MDSVLTLCNCFCKSFLNFLTIFLVFLDNIWNRYGFFLLGLACVSQVPQPLLLVVGWVYNTPKNSQIFLCVLPQSSFGHALGKGDKNWISRCLSWRFCFGCTPVHSQSAELQPFYGRLLFATSPPICHFRCFWSQDAMDLFNFSTVFLIFPKWQMGGVCLF